MKSDAEIGRVNEPLGFSFSSCPLYPGHLNPDRERSNNLHIIIIIMVLGVKSHLHDAFLQSVCLPWPPTVRSKAGNT